MVCLILNIINCNITEVIANHPDNKIITTQTISLKDRWGMDISEPVTIEIIAYPNIIYIPEIKFKLLPDYNFDMSVKYIYMCSRYYTLMLNGTIKSLKEAIIPSATTIPEEGAGKTHDMFIYAKTDYSTENMISTLNIPVPQANPVIILENIEQNSIEMRVDARNNKNYLVIYLQRYSDSSKQWVTIANLNLSNLTFKDTGLQANTTYRYRTMMRNGDIITYNWQGGNFFVDFTTASDPGVVAALKAENAAQLAKVAADSASKDALNARLASLDSKEYSSRILNEVKNELHGLEAIKNEILNLRSELNQPKLVPQINYLKGLNNATGTKLGYITLDTSVINATHYRINGGPWQMYNIKWLDVQLHKGLNRIEIEFAYTRGGQEISEDDVVKGILNIFSI